MTKSVLLAHPTGNTFVRAASQAFLDAGCLHGLHTSLGWVNRPWLSASLQRRAYQLPPTLLHRHRASLELARLLATRLGWRQWLVHETGALSVDRLYHSFDQAVAHCLERSSRGQQLPSAVMAYEDGALATFQAANAFGLRKVYELPIGHWRLGRAIFAAEAEHRPAWASTLEGLVDSPAKLARKDAELAAADLVLVPSSFVKASLAAAPVNAPVVVVPYGCPHPLSAPPPRPAHGPLRLLFVGGLSQRKGLADLLDAVSLLGDHVTLTLIGRRPAARCDALDEALQHHRWLPSLPNSVVQAEMRQHDVLVLPSLFEGLPLVISEALAQGLPIIATANAAADERISHGVEGFVVPIRSPESIASCLERLIADRDRVQAMAAACLQRAATSSWAQYRNTLIKVIAPLLANPEDQTR
jgi:glycosyltransferase involved in cell wall biosynthesis